jgi:hypothetical protein
MTCAAAPGAFRLFCFLGSAAIAESAESLRRARFADSRSPASRFSPFDFFENSAARHKS